MSESLPFYSPDDSFNREFSKVQAELDDLLAAEQQRQTAIENTAVFYEAHAVQKLLDAQTYADHDTLARRTIAAADTLNQAARSAHLLDQSVALIGPDRAITQYPAQLDKCHYIPEGNFRGFIIGSVPATSPYATDKDQAILRPQLYYQLETHDTTGHRRYYFGDVTATSLLFNPSHEPIELDDKTAESEAELQAIDHFNDFNQVLHTLQAASFRKAATHAFYLLNKSVYADEPSFDDMILDTASSQLDLNHAYDIVADFGLEASHDNQTGQAQFRFIGDGHDTIKLINAPIQTLSCLPRGFLSTSQTPCKVLNRNQKALYLTTMCDDKTYHIPFEYLRYITKR